MKVILQVRPEGVGPEWWPHTATSVDAPYNPEALSYCLLLHWHWATIEAELGSAETEDEETGETEIVESWSIRGHTIGFDQERTIPLDAARAVADAWYEEHGDGPWQFRTLAVE
jgi:hypothetical protein